MVILENVTALLKRPAGGGPSNAYVAYELLRACLPMHVKIFKLDPRMFGSPQVRGRLYFLAIPISRLPGMDPVHVDEMLRLLMHGVRRH